MNFDINRLSKLAGIGGNGGLLTEASNRSMHDDPTLDGEAEHRFGKGQLAEVDYGAAMEAEGELEEEEMPEDAHAEGHYGMPEDAHAEGHYGMPEGEKEEGHHGDKVMPEAEKEEGMMGMAMDEDDMSDEGHGMAYDEAVLEDDSLAKAARAVTQAHFGETDAMNESNDIVFEVDDSALRREVLRMKNQRLDETKLRNVIQAEIQDILDEMSKYNGDGSWIYGDDKPKRSKPGQITRGGLSLGFK